MSDDKEQLQERLLTAADEYDRSYHQGLRAAHTAIYGIPSLRDDDEVLAMIDTAAERWKVAAINFMAVKREYRATLSDPRNNAEDAYQAFLHMPASEWQGLLISLFNGGVLTPAEQEGFDRAIKDRQ